MKLEELAQFLRDGSNGALTNVSTAVILAMVVVMGLIVVMSVVALITSLCIAVKYARYNRRENSLGKAGKDICRNVLDKNGLEQISVKSSGSIMFGNSYSHFFKKIRLRRMTWKKSSVSSLAMAYQKAQLAVLDNNGDADMKKRIHMTPLIYFGPLAMIPLVLGGILLDFFIFKSGNGICTMILVSLATLLYVASFVMALMVLRTEKKAQKMALEEMRQDNVSEKDIDDCKNLFRLYNIEYVNDMIIAMLEVIYRVLQLVTYFQNSSNAQSNK